MLIRSFVFRFRFMLLLKAVLIRFVHVLLEKERNNVVERTKKENKHFLPSLVN